MWHCFLLWEVNINVWEIHELVTTHATKLSSIDSVDSSNPLGAHTCG